MNQTCYLCGSSKSKTVFIENKIPIVRCQNCGHVYSTYEQDEHYEGYWDEEEYDLNWWDLAHRAIYRDFIQTFLKSDSGRILDVGCGLGFFIKAIQEQKPGWEAIGYEISEKAVSYANRENGLNSVYSGIVEKSGLEESSFDYITLWDVIEHIPKPQPLLNYLNSLLKPGGYLFMQTPNFPIQLLKAKLKVTLKGMQSDGHYLEAKDHINDYNMESLARLGRQCGFQKSDYYILKPILSMAGGGSGLGAKAKLAYYYVTKFIWNASFHSLNWNNTLFVLMKK